MSTRRAIWITTALLGFGSNAISSSAVAGDFQAQDYSSPRDSAVPGEYFFHLGVDAVKARDYRHAIAMYKVAASWAYKPAEYNLGVIFTKGEGGVPEDHVQGLAWFTLAAERGNKNYVAIRDRVRAALPPHEVGQADALVTDLTRTYGDAQALPRAKARWRDVRNSATGSHLGFVEHLQVGSLNERSGLKKGGTGKYGTGGSGAQSAADISAGNTTDGSIAYRELRETDNPYDPRFDVGTVTVGEVTTAEKDANNKERSKETPLDAAKGNEKPSFRPDSL